MENSNEFISGKGIIRIADTKFEWQVSVPQKTVPLKRLLPILQGLTDKIMEVAVSDVRETGAEISCTKGCGACCRQLVPVSRTEAIYLRELIDGMSEERRSEIRRQFENAIERLEKSGLLARLISRGSSSGKDRTNLGLDYFYQSIACPFLENEACSIYEDRPLACREYLVSSPPENCQAPKKENISCIPIPARLSQIIQKLENSDTDASPTKWIPLILILLEGSFQKQQETNRSGPDWLNLLFASLKT